MNLLEKLVEDLDTRSEVQRRLDDMQKSANVLSSLSTGASNLFKQNPFLKLGLIAAPVGAGAVMLGERASDYLSDKIVDGIESKFPTDPRPPVLKTAAMNKEASWVDHILPPFLQSPSAKAMLLASSFAAGGGYATAKGIQALRKDLFDKPDALNPADKPALGSAGVKPLVLKKTAAMEKDAFPGWNLLKSIGGAIKGGAKGVRDGFVNTRNSFKTPAPGSNSAAGTSPVTTGAAPAGSVGDDLLPTTEAAAAKNWWQRRLNGTNALLAGGGLLGVHGLARATDGHQINNHNDYLAAQQVLNQSGGSLLDKWRVTLANPLTALAAQPKGFFGTDSMLAGRVSGLGKKFEATEYGSALLDQIRNRQSLLATRAAYDDSSDRTAASTNATNLAGLRSLFEKTQLSDPYLQTQFRYSSGFGQPAQVAQAMQAAQPKARPLAVAAPQV